MLNFKLVDGHLINFANVLHVAFEKDAATLDRKATFHFVDGSKLAFGPLVTSALLKWVEDMTDSEVDVIVPEGGLGS